MLLWSGCCEDEPTEIQKKNSIAYAQKLSEKYEKEKAQTPLH
jgi:hypothetical protein